MGVWAVLIITHTTQMFNITYGVLGVWQRLAVRGTTSLCLMGLVNMCGSFRPHLLILILVSSGVTIQGTRSHFSFGRGKYFNVSFLFRESVFNPRTVEHSSRQS